MTTRRRLTLVALLVVGALGLGPEAQAAGFHSYSVGRESSAGSGYSGVSVYRVDQNLTNASTCIYQSQWVGSTTEWVELGTAWGPQCVVGNGYWFMGYGSNGTFHLLDQRQANPGQSHVFALYRTGSIYIGYVDSTEIDRLTWPRWFNRVEAGLESYMNLAVVGAHNYDQLKYSYLAAPWQWWSGQDAVLLDAQMCGLWSLSTRWRGGQNVTC
jgi:hypothetical protein